MRLPKVSLALPDWKPTDLGAWESLRERADRLQASAGQSDAFQGAVERFRAVVRTRNVAPVRDLFQTRVGARALTWLWLEEERVAAVLLTPKVLDALVEAQGARLTRMTLIQLLQLYFRRFDELDELNAASGAGLREVLERHLREQLKRIPDPPVNPSLPDPIASLKARADTLLALNGPIVLAERVRKEGRELGEAFASLGLSGLGRGRYADVCRARFYLETLKRLEIGRHDPVFDELLKPSVHKAPYDGDRRIGHAALEVLIDRAGDQAPGEAWQDFVLALAGDPRIASTARNFAEWWRPLGQARIERVRSWLSREDLRLFLQAVEEYGKVSRNEDLQRMFPSRKVFLEGLYDQKLIRSSRLMLGRDAERSIRRLLGRDVLTSFVKLENMPEQAVIYLDCGDFHIVEGSHSFKIWTYLERPSDLLGSYDVTRLSHSDLTKKVPQQYGEAWPGRPHSAVVHSANSFWQRHVFEFLAENGVSVDIEAMLTREDYREYLREHGRPVVGVRKAGDTRGTTQSKGTGSAKAKGKTARGSRAAGARAVAGASSAARARVGSADDLARRYAKLSNSGKQVLEHLLAHPGDRARVVGNVLGLSPKAVNRLLNGELEHFCQQDASYGWSLTRAARAALQDRAA